MSTLENHRREVAYCTYCPKMCRFSCPVSNATGDEAHTPWGKMTGAFGHLTGTRPFDVSSGAATYACTSCLRCRTHCRHSNEVGPALADARVQVVEEGEAPKAIDKLKARFASHGNPHGVDLAARAREISHESEGKAYFAGCTSIAREPLVVQSALDAAAGFGLRLALAPSSSLCCGYSLWAAGMRDEFLENAARFAKAIEGHDELVVGDPGCAYTLLKVYRDCGIEIRPKISLLVDLLAERLEYAFGRAPLSLKLSYHDACLLGRGLGRYEGPRRLLRAAVGEFDEAPEHGEDSGCSGAGGILPLTMPEAARAIAKAQGEEQGAPGHRVVTACPSAARHFRGSGVEALDLFTVLARWIAARDDEDDRGELGR